MSKTNTKEEHLALREMATLSVRNLLSLELIEAIGNIHNVDAMRLVKNSKTTWYKKVKKVK